MTTNIRAKRILLIGSVILWGLVGFYFLLIPEWQRDGLLPWGMLILSVAATSGIVLAARGWFGTWRGLGSLLLLYWLAQVWLVWQSPLWDSSTFLLHNINTLMMLVAGDSLVAMLVSLLLLLICRDISALALAIAWAGFPICMITTMQRYQTMERLNNLPLTESFPLLTPMCLLPYLAVAGATAFVIHLSILVYKELTGRV